MMTPCQRSISQKRVQRWMNESSKARVLKSKTTIPVPTFIQFRQTIDEMISKADRMIEMIKESSTHEE
jgi:hypothetical protein